MWRPLPNVQSVPARSEVEQNKSIYLPALKEETFLCLCVWGEVDKEIIIHETELS